MRLAATPTLELFQRTLFEFGTRVNDHHVFREHPERRQQWRQARIQCWTLYLDVTLNLRLCLRADKAKMPISGFVRMMIKKLINFQPPASFHQLSEKFLLRKSGVFYENTE
jgi:hypothetical protein